MANFFSNTSDLQNILDVLQTKALPTIHTSVCEAFPTAIDQVIQPPEGYYYSQVNVAGDSNLIADNIKSGVTIFGVEGALTGSGSSFETYPDFTYSVNSIDDADYGFALNDAGYYESQNKEVDESYAICRVNFTVSRQCNIAFEVINYGEQGWDYGFFGKLDTELELSNLEDSTDNIHYNFYTISDEFVRKVVYEAVTVGNHFVEVKYIKDDSYNAYNDTLQFKVIETSALDQEILDGLIEADEDLKAENIRAGVNILGIDGTYGAVSPDIDAIFNRTISGSYTNSDLAAIPSGALCYFDNVTSVNFPMVSEVGDMGMYLCPSLISASLPNCRQVGTSAFANCYNLTTLYIPQCRTADMYAFAWTGLKTLTAWNLTTAGYYAFGGCSLSSVNLYLYTVPGYAFAYCYSLAKASFPYASSISSSAFIKCSRLSQLYLKSSKVCTLANSNAFSSTPFVGYSTYFSGTPYIYVPSSLIASYQAATNWSYFSNYFSAI